MQAFAFMPSNAAGQLSITITNAIPSIPSDGHQHTAFFISVVDGSGNPHPLSYALNITLTSSDERVLQVPKSVTIKAAGYFAIVNATSTIIESKSVEVTAAASGFQSSKINAQVGSPAGTPQSLKVTILPNSLLPLVSEQADVIVSVVDSYGNPAKARSDLSITLSSSDLQIADVLTKNIVIPKGSISGKLKVVTTGFQGSSTITASVSNLKSDSATLRVAGPKPTKLYLWSPPYQLVGEDNYVFIGIVDSSLKPVKLVTPITVSLYSSNSTRMEVPSTVTIGSGEWNTLVTNTVKGLGTATIFASAEDLITASIQLSVVEPYQDSRPTTVKIYSMAPSFPTDERSYKALLVQIVDQYGIPYISTGTTRVDVFSSVSAILDTTSPINIASGKSWETVTAVPKLPGDVTITAGSQGLAATQTSISSYTPLPDTISIQTPPIPSEGEVEACIITTSSSIPAPVQQDSTILLDSSNTGVGSSTESPVILKKKYFTYTTIKGNSPGQFSFTATTSGIPVSRTQLSVLETKPSTFYLSYIKPIVNYNFPIVVQLVSSSGGSSVTYEPIQINVVSSNTTNMYVPSTLTLGSENTEILLYGKGLTTKTSTLTASSSGFKSLIAQITPTPINILILISANDRYQPGEVAQIKATVTLDGSPVTGIPVTWKGTGIVSNNTLTNSIGVAENTLIVQENENKIEAAIDLGAGYLHAVKTIIGGLSTYQLVISSNVPVTIVGSGSYSYGVTVILEAPATVSMQSVMGILGGKYNFKQWTGAVESTNNPSSLLMTGEQPTINVNAIYTEDTFMAIVFGVIILIVVAGGVFIYYTRFMKKEKPELKTTSPEEPKRKGAFE